MLQKNTTKEYKTIIIIIHRLPCLPLLSTPRSLTLDGDKVCLALVGHRLGHERLSAAGGPVEENASRGGHAELLELLRVLHRVLHQLLQLALDTLV